MTDLSFTLACVPPMTTSQEKRAMKLAHGIRFFKSQALQAAQTELIYLMRPHRPSVPFDGPVALSLVFTWPHLASSPQALRAYGARWKTTPPDLDNAAKLVIDCLKTLGFLQDDARVCRLELEKWHGVDVGIRIRLRQLEHLGA